MGCELPNRCTGKDHPFDAAHAFIRQAEFLCYLGCGWERGFNQGSCHELFIVLLGFGR